MLTGHVIIRDEAIQILRAYVQNGILHVSGLTPGKPVWIYDILGTLIYTTHSPSKGGEMTSQNLSKSEENIPLPGHGIYIITDGTKAVKVIY